MDDVVSQITVEPEIPECERESVRPITLEGKIEFENVYLNYDQVLKLKL